MQAAVHKKARTELGKFTSEYSKDVKERTGRWALAFLSAESANNHSRWYTKLVQEFWDHNFKGFPRPTVSYIQPSILLDAVFQSTRQRCRGS
jgi:hypothetical protein